MKNKITRFQDIPKFTDVGSYAVDYPLSSIDRWVRESEDEMGLNLCPDFQRGHVWTERQQQKYIEFLLRGGKTGRDVYFNCPGWHHQVRDGAYNEFVCVDGLQRITAIRKFTNNELKVFGSYYREYTDSLRIIQDTIRVHINDLKTRKAVLQWYLEMNSGGTPHTRTELNRVKDLIKECED